MPSYPNVVIQPVDQTIWLWVVIPAILAVVFLIAERIIERLTERQLGKPIVGVGYILMGVSLLVASMSFSFVPDVIQAEQTSRSVKALEGAGFSEVRITVGSGAFGAIYEGELMRGVLIPDPAGDNEYYVQQTFPRD